MYTITFKGTPVCATKNAADLTILEMIISDIYNTRDSIETINTDITMDYSVLIDNGVNEKEIFVANEFDADLIASHFNSLCAMLVGVCYTITVNYFTATIREIKA